MIYKQFNKENHATNDKPAKDLVINFLKSKGLDAMENPDKYGIDIVVPRYEVERREIWIDKFPFKTVHIPARKEKFLKHSIVYVVVNKDFDKIMFCRSEIIRQYDLIEVPNKSVPKGEYFYDVPIEKWRIYNIEDANENS
jgi:hypothetical protein